MYSFLCCSIARIHSSNNCVGGDHSLHYYLLGVILFDGLFLMNSSEVPHILAYLGVLLDEMTYEMTWLDIDYIHFL